VSPRDPTVFVLVSTGFLLLAALASWIPARRAARLAPTEALREE
jgi:ABC-type lipoprotein release transport system permease subunit